MNNQTTNPSDCGCNKSISSKAESVLRLNYSPVSPTNQKKIEEFKTKLAQLYTQVESLEWELSDLESSPRQEDMERYICQHESQHEAKRHLQLASYYIIHALTA